jgi:hypothetical protein
VSDIQNSCAAAKSGKKRAMQIEDMTLTGALIKELWALKIESASKKVKSHF